MKLLFFVNESLSETNGISKKIRAQVKAIRQLGIETDICYLQGDDIITARLVNDEVLEKFPGNTFLNRFAWRCSYGRLFQYIIRRNIDTLYIRYTHYGNPFFNQFLRRLKKAGVQILLELPTYPYDNEYRNLKLTSRAVLLLEKLTRRNFRKSVSRIVTLTHHPEIFGVPTIRFSNGIDPDILPMITPRKQEAGTHLIGVASIGFWHGYDRVIEGLRKYYQAGADVSGKVYFHIVGDSDNPESIRYRKLVILYNLQDYVIFYGKRSGKELDDLFNGADIAVGSLACHRISLDNVRPLKNREYCARGIRFFYAETDDDFEGQEFVYKVPSNDDPVDIPALLVFIREHNIPAEKIRKFACDKLTWTRQFDRILSEAAAVKATPQPVTGS